MITENVVVSRVDGKYAWATMQRKTACGQCSVNKGCGTSVIANWYEGKRTEIRVLDPVGVKVGDVVVVGLDDHALVKGSFAVYFLPLVSLFAFWMLGNIVFSEFSQLYSEGWQIVSGMFGLVVGFLLVKRFSIKIADDKRYQAIVLRKLEQSITFVDRSSKSEQLPLV